ncbi:hypothetical protein [Bacillus paramycoides]|uniref:hypothetical protein n=1 Tax=Bacillus paramycoides TaxID=2026194 RepID=UPI002E22E42B|nr:hypothetical protein [Bacillus paramycoides]
MVSGEALERTKEHFDQLLISYQKDLNATEEDVRAAYNIVHAKGSARNKKSEKLANFLKTEYSDKGKLGIAIGEGVY